MKNFLKETGLFLGVVAFLAFIFFHFNQFLFRKDKVILPADTETLICGSSISARGLDPDILPASINVSRAGRTTLDVLKILEKVLPDNPQIKNVTVDFSPQGLSKRMEYFYYYPGFMQNRMKGMYSLLELSDLETYHVNYRIYIKSLLRYECVPNFYYVQKSLDLESNLPPYLGHFIEDKSPILPSEIPEDVVEDLFLYSEQGQWLNKNARPNLESIVKLTDSLGVDLWLFSGPLHKDLRALIPEKYFDVFSESANEALAFNHVHFLDYTAYPLPDSCFKNLNHINYYGAQIISPLVAEQMKKEED